MAVTDCIKDSFGRKINYARLSVTDRCNLRCSYCMPRGGVCKKLHSDILTFEQFDNIVQVLVSLGIDKIRLTGGEPLVRRGIVDFVKKIASYQSIRDLAMTTNGQLLGKYAHDLKSAGLMRLNISIDTFDEKKFYDITGGGNLKDTLNGIDAAKKENFKKLKINVVLIGGFNDMEIPKFVELTRHEDIDVRFIELMPIGECASWDKKNFIPNENVLKVCQELIPCDSNDSSEPAKLFKLPDGMGKVGLINAISHKFCSNCNRLRFTADGKIKNCLHSDAEIDIKNIVDDKIALKQAIRQAIEDKPFQHHLESGNFISRNMFNIGG